MFVPLSLSLSHALSLSVSLSLPLCLSLSLSLSASLSLYPPLSPTHTPHDTHNTDTDKTKTDTYIDNTSKGRAGNMRLFRRRKKSSQAFISQILVWRKGWDIRYKDGRQEIQDKRAAKELQFTRDYMKETRNMGREGEDEIPEIKIHEKVDLELCTIFFAARCKLWHVRGSKSGTGTKRHVTKPPTKEKWNIPACSYNPLFQYELTPMHADMNPLLALHRFVKFLHSNTDDESRNETTRS